MPGDQLDKQADGGSKMAREPIDYEEIATERITEEEKIREKVDEEGNRWKKVYFGGGAHFRNWLSQVQELYGEDNIKVEEMDSRGFQCYEEGGEKLYRIWARDSELEQGDELPWD